MLINNNPTTEELSLEIENLKREIQALKNFIETFQSFDGIFIIKSGEVGANKPLDFQIYSEKWGFVALFKEISLTNGSFVLNDSRIKNSSKAFLQLKQISGTLGTVMAICEDGKLTVVSTSSSDNSVFYLQVWF